MAFEQKRVVAKVEHFEGAAQGPDRSNGLFLFGEVGERFVELQRGVHRGRQPKPRVAVEAISAVKRTERSDNGAQCVRSKQQNSARVQFCRYFASAHLERSIRVRELAASRPPSNIALSSVPDRSFALKSRVQSEGTWSCGRGGRSGGETGTAACALLLGIDKPHIAVDHATPPRAAPLSGLKACGKPPASAPMKREARWLRFPRPSAPTPLKPHREILSEMRPAPPGAPASCSEAPGMPQPQMLPEAWLCPINPLDGGPIVFVGRSPRREAGSELGTAGSAGVVAVPSAPGTTQRPWPRRRNVTTASSTERSWKFRSTSTLASNAEPPFA